MQKSDENKTGVALLRMPFEAHQISKKPQSTKAQSEALKTNRNLGIKCNVCGQWHHQDAIHLDYVGHAALTDRLLDADSNWYWEPLAFKDGLPLFDKDGGLWIKLTIKDITRIGYGNAEPSNYKEIGSREKEVIGDALRNAAMRFGAALDLWHKGKLHKEPVIAPAEKSKVAPPIMPQKQTQEPPPYDEWAPSNEVYTSTPPPETNPGHNGPSEAQIKRYFAMTKQLGWSNEDALTHARQKSQKDSLRSLTKKEYKDITDDIQKEIDKYKHNFIK